MSQERIPDAQLPAELSRCPKCGGEFQVSRTFARIDRDAPRGEWASLDLRCAAGHNFGWIEGSGRLIPRPDDLRRAFHAVCPAGHESLPPFEPNDLRAAIAKGDVTYFCYRCGRNVTIPPEQYAGLLAWLDDRHPSA